MRSVILCPLVLSLALCTQTGKNVQSRSPTSRWLLVAGALIATLLVAGAVYYYYYVYGRGAASAGAHTLGDFDGDVEAAGSTADIRVSEHAAPETLAPKPQPPTSSPDFKIRFKKYVEEARRSILGADSGAATAGGDSQFAPPTQTALSKPFAAKEGETQAVTGAEHEESRGGGVKDLGKSFKDAVVEGDGGRAGKSGKRRHRKH